MFVALLASAADESIGSLDFKSAGVDQVLPLYKSMSGLELFIDSRVKQVGFTINLRSSAPLTKAQAVKQIEKALLEQARVVITRLDDKRASVTYNDALPIAPPSKSPDQ
jgi:type II secretory pathway component GspD/PulD (secretin)